MADRPERLTADSKSTQFTFGVKTTPARDVCMGCGQQFELAQRAKALLEPIVINGDCRAQQEAFDRRRDEIDAFLKEIIDDGF